MALLHGSVGSMLFRPFAHRRRTGFHYRACCNLISDDIDLSSMEVFIMGSVVIWMFASWLYILILGSVYGLYELYSNAR